MDFNVKRKKMSTFELAPTIENYLQTLNDDVVKRNDDVVNFYRLLYFLEGPAALALDGQWGSGKTFFVNQVMLLVKALNSNIKFLKRNQVLDSLDLNDEFISKFSNDYLVVYYDAWFNDNDEDPLLSVLYEICKQGNMDFELSVATLNKMGNILSSIIKNATKIDLKEMVESFKSHDKLAEYVSMREYDDKIADLLNSISNKKIILFIDELDRCKPTYAVKLLERIKRYFNIDNFICVYSLNMQQLQHTIKSIYGADFSAHKYLDRFFSVTIPMPEYNRTNFIHHFMPAELQTATREVIHEVIIMYGFTLRETVHFYENLQMAIGDFDKFYNKIDTVYDEDKFIFIVRNYVVPLTLALKIHDVDLFYDFIAGKNKKPLLDMFNWQGISNYVLRFIVDNKESYSIFTSLKGEELNNAVDILYEACFCDSLNLQEKIGVNNRIYGPYKDFILKVVGCRYGASERTV